METKRTARISLSTGVMVLLCGLLWQGCTEDGEIELDDGAADLMGPGVFRLYDLHFGVDLDEDVSNAQVLTMNEQAYSAKLQVIDAAGPEDHLDLVYYIFAYDESSAFMATRLIEAANRGAHVRLLLDYFSNIGAYHYFQQMISSVTGSGSIQVRFYNPPSQTLQSFFRYLLTPCDANSDGAPDTDFLSDACSDNRRANMNNLVTVTVPPNPERQEDGGTYQVNRDVAFFSGVLGGNQAALDAVVAPMQAQVEAFQGAQPDEEMSQEDKDNAIRALRLIFQAKVEGSLFAKIGLLMLADKLDPMFDLLDALGFEEATNGQGDPLDFAHLTDYIHQKLTLLTPASGGDVQFVLGGRNVQNSYHLSDTPPSWEAKYIFLDVDVRANATGENRDQLMAAFDRQWNFALMVKDINDVAGLVVNADLLSEFPDGFIYAQAGQPDSSGFQQYYSYENGQVTPRASWPHPAYDLASAGQLRSFDLTGEFEYVENTSYGYDCATMVCDVRTYDPSHRVFGSEADWDDEFEGGNNIQNLWVEMLDEVCFHSDEPQEVIIHNAYLLLPTHFQYMLQRRILGECPGVSHFTIITNSFGATDLNVINTFNESYIQPLLAAAGDRLTYYEYTTNMTNADNPVERSLHAKVMIFGDYVFIGSANADMRSQLMDSNNGIFVRGAGAFAQQYREWLHTEIIGRLAFEDPHNIAGKSNATLLAENTTALFSPQNAGRWVDDPAQIAQLTAQISELGTILNNSMTNMMTYDLLFPSEGNLGQCESDPWQSDPEQCCIPYPDEWSYRGCASAIEDGLDALDGELMPL